MSERVSVRTAKPQPTAPGGLAAKAAPALRVKGLRRAFTTAAGELEVLRGVDVDVRPGEVVGLVGPSGSGKSSLLHAAGLLEKPTAGEVWINGRSCLGLSDLQRTRIRREHVGFVYQFHHLLPEFTARENVAMPQLMTGKRHKAALEEADRLLALMGLAARTTHQPGQLSGGEQQRVAIARAIANGPRLVLADEPTGNLDPVTSGAVFQSLFELARVEKVAVLVATHNFELTKFMDRVWALRDGRLEAWSGA